MARKLAAGNWKMHGASASLAEIEALAAEIGAPGVEVLICPPATLISRLADKTANTPIQIGGQDCHAAEMGAHTGDISAGMLADAGANHVILGHSERRTDHGETNATVNAKTEAAQAAGITAIVCIGETLAEREAGQTLDIVTSQLAGSVPDTSTAANLVIAYEPVWAIGTGLVPTNDQIAEVHSALRSALSDRFGSDFANAIPLLYGGSVKPGNAAEIFSVAHVDGALVGGASLKSSDFAPIVKALASS